MNQETNLFCSEGEEVRKSIALSGVYLNYILEKQYSSTECFIRSEMKGKKSSTYDFLYEKNMSI